MYTAIIVLRDCFRIVSFRRQNRDWSPARLTRHAHHTKANPTCVFWKLRRLLIYRFFIINLLGWILLHYVSAESSYASKMLLVERFAEHADKGSLACY